MRHFKLNPISFFIASSLAFSSMAQALDVGAGAVVDVNSGEEVNNVTVTDDGILNINNGGASNGTIVNSDMQKPNSGEHINNGGTSNGTVVLNGYQFVDVGGHAEGTTLYGSSQQFVDGTANNTVLESNDTSLAVSGTVDNTTINAGVMYVWNGLANNTNINGDGQVYIEGEANVTILNDNASFFVKGEGTATNTIINDSAKMYVTDSANVHGTTINGGEMSISGSSALYGSSAIVDGTIINGGVQTISNSESIVMNTTINGGEQFVYGTTTNTTINGGMSTIYNGGLADGDTKINADGKMMMNAGSHATDVETNGGTLIVSAPYYGITDVPAAQVDSLTMNGGRVVFQAGMNAGAREGDSSSYSQLNIGELTGSGNFVFNTSLADGVGNFVTINHGSGHFGVTVNDSGKEISDHTDLTVNLINDQSGDIDFTLMSTRGGSIRAVDGGAYMYVLKQETGKDGLDGNVWHLGAMTGDENGGGDNGNSGGGLVTTPSTDAVLSLANAGLNIMRGEMDGLRAARQNQSSDRQHGEGSVWGQYLGKKSAAETSNGAAYKLYQNGMELGGDVVTDLGKSHLVTGGFVSLTGNNVKHARGGTSSVDSYGLGVYTTWYDNSGLYLDGTLKANRLESQLSARMTNGDMTSGKWHQYGLSAALEAGYTFTPMDSLTVEPFARMTGTTINDANVKLNNGMTAKTGKARSLTAEAGSRAAINFSLGNTAFRPYLSISVEQELAHANETIINDVNRFKNHQNGTSGKYGAGITVSPAKDVMLYGELNYRQGSYMEEPVQGVAGIRVSF